MDELDLRALNRVVCAQDELQPERFILVERVVVVDLEIDLPGFQVIGFH